MLSSDLNEYLGKSYSNTYLLSFIFAFLHTFSMDL